MIIPTTTMPSGTEGHAEHGAAHADHSGHEKMFQKKFWISLLLSLPVLLYSKGLQMMLGVSMPAFPGSQWIAPVFSLIVFYYGGLPFLKMSIPELKNRQPGMMTLISLAITVAFIYSLATLFLPGQIGLLLGTGYTDRYHAAGALDRDAQHPPGFRRPGCAGQADA